MTIDYQSPEFEEQFLQECLVDLRNTHPQEAALTTALLGTLNYEKSCIHDLAQLRGIVFALGNKLSAQGSKGLSSWNAWLLQFVKDGALSEEQAAYFKRQAEAILR